MFASLAAAAVLAAPQSDFDAYLQRPESACRWRQMPSTAAYPAELRLTSQVWQGIPWRHDLVVVSPKGVKPGSQAILFITGNRAGRDLPMAQALADTAGMEVAMLFNIPNQPLWGRNEDGLIAYTFGQYLKTHDATWPLLFPMAKSGIKAMDALQDWSRGRLKSFVVTGASKRGWTTWLVGASRDRRIKAIAPMVIDILNMPAQLAKQKKMFAGKLSEQIADYSNTGLTEILSSEAGRELTRKVDPYTYLPRIKVPVLMIIGGNDRYWTVDAHTVYWNDIHAPKLLKIVPNAGHSLGDGREALASLSFFARSVYGMIPGGLPKVAWTPGSLSLNEPKGDSRYAGYETWIVPSTTLDFRDSKWVDAKSARIDGSMNTASFLEYKFKSGGLAASFDSGVVVRPAGSR